MWLIIPKQHIELCVYSSLQKYTVLLTLLLSGRGKELPDSHSEDGMRNWQRVPSLWLWLDPSVKYKFSSWHHSLLLYCKLCKYVKCLGRLDYDNGNDWVITLIFPNQAFKGYHRRRTVTYILVFTLNIIESSKEKKRTDNTFSNPTKTDEWSVV